MEDYQKSQPHDVEMQVPHHLHTEVLADLPVLVLFLASFALESLTAGLAWGLGEGRSKEIHRESPAEGPEHQRIPSGGGEDGGLVHIHITGDERKALGAVARRSYGR